MKKQEFVLQDLLSKIYQNKFENGKLKNQRELAKEYKVSRFTVQKVVKSLEDIGIITCKQGSGMFINKEWINNPLIFNSLTKTKYSNISSKCLKLEKYIASEEERQLFNLNEGEEIWYFERIRIVNYKIEQFESSKLPVKLFPDFDEKTVEFSIQKYVDSKYSISHYITNYTPELVSKKLAGILLVKRGSPAMRIKNRGILEDGQLFEYSEICAINYAVSYISPFDRPGHTKRI